MSKYGVFSGLCFPVYGPKKTPYLDTFHTLNLAQIRFNGPKMTIFDTVERRFCVKYI